MSKSLSIAAWPAQDASIWPGVAVCMLAALAASFVSEHHGGPALLYALLMGLALNFLSDHPSLGAGVSVCARTARWGVALLGARITLSQVPLLPGLMVAFIALVLVGSLGWLSQDVTEAASSASRWLLVVAIAAVGVKTRLQDLAKLGWRPLVMLVCETLFIAAVVGLAAAFDLIGR